METKIFNFCAGPAVIADEVLKKAQQALIDYNNTGMSILSISHRSSDFMDLMHKAIKDVKNSSVDIAISSVEKIIKNSIDKKKLDKIYISSIEEAKKILKNKSI